MWSNVSGLANLRLQKASFFSGLIQSSSNSCFRCLGFRASVNLAKVESLER